MVSEEFKRNVASGDVVTVRSALVDYLIIDPSFKKFDEALDYAESNLSIIEPPQSAESSDFENDPDAWDESYLNKQKVALMVYFSQARINHLKKVITKVLGSETHNKIEDEIDTCKDTSSSKSASSSKTGRTGRTILSEQEVQPSMKNNEKSPQNTPKPDNANGTSTTPNNRTGRRIVGITEGKTIRSEEEVCPIDIATWMIGGGIAIAAVGGMTAGVGVAIAKPVMVQAGIATACVGGGVAITGGIVKVIKNM
jgi:hypothetical protein